MVVKARCVHAAQVCERPALAFRMAAQLAATWNAAARADPAEAHVTACSGAAAERALPYTLPALLGAPAWLPAVEPVVGQLAALLDTQVGHIPVGEHDDQVSLMVAEFK